jgi:peptidoglycan/LPS O-acetylase OafA/YrhL
MKEGVVETVSAPKERVFFPNLDGLRFLSFFSVYLFHVYLLLFDKYRPSGPGYSITKFLFQNGETGVNFFFVLSGFLITYLLIEERRFTGKIHVGNFYVRRILRIWPLFYLCLAFGLGLYPILKKAIGGELYQVTNPWTYFVFLNNFDFIRHGAPATISVLWSVAIEEQFYLVWPLILLLVPVRSYRYVFYGIIAATLVFRMVFHDNERFLQFHTLAVVGDMAFGGLLAYYSIFSDRFKRAVKNMPRGVIAGIYLAGVIIFLFRKSIFPGYFMVFERLFISGICGLIILEQNFADRSLFKMKNYKWISKMGLYTYGLYCLHVIAMTFTEQGLVKAGLSVRNPVTCVLIGVIGFVVAIMVALLSYYFFEKRFLTLKNRFAFITRQPEGGAVASSRKR